jgi:hypothetical protein
MPTPAAPRADAPSRRAEPLTPVATPGASTRAGSAPRTPAEARDMVEAVESMAHQGECASPGARAPEWTWGRSRPVANGGQAGAEARRPARPHPAGIGIGMTLQQWLQQAGLGSAGSPVRQDLQKLWSRACQSSELEELMVGMQQEELDKAARQADDVAKYTSILVRSIWGSWRLAAGCWCPQLKSNTLLCQLPWPSAAPPAALDGWIGDTCSGLLPPPPKPTQPPAGG